MRRGGHASERQLSNPYLCSKDTPGSMEGTNMKPIISAVLASLAVLGLVAGCSSDSKSSSSGPTGTTLAGDGSASGDSTTPNFSLPPGVPFPSGVVTLPPGMTLPTLPPGLTIPPGGTFPSDMTIPAQFIDVMLAQLEAAGLKADRPCVKNLLKTKSFRTVVMSGSTPSPEMLQSLIACFRG